MGRNLLETVMGAVVLLVAAFFLVFAYSQADLGTVHGYTVTAAFQSVGGLDDGADVRINGIKIGTVLDQNIDPDDFDAVVRMSIMPNIHLPDDTVATVDSSGLLGDKYLKLIPGRSAKTIAPGGKIAKTKTYKSLEEMVGDIIFLATDSSGKRPSGDTDQPSPSQSPKP
jgi:phospholipid/cholesterol/gamma-HCH transport system substrate-binding protein